MTTIEQHSGCATLINVFTVEPARAEELAELLADATEHVMRHVPGFISANIHLSSDGTRVVNYAQWDSAEAFHAMANHPGTREHMDKAAALATSYDPHLYTVESVHTVDASAVVDPAVGAFDDPPARPDPESEAGTDVHTAPAA
ncbi:MAG: tetracenomycin polyketide synthesis hydroxylase TcmH [Mycobacterium sp.]|jgi:heme-degrading monooxygenase HmoA|nr:tetracenomycin polyketide synthesis hydroxylase TcmH [Mycobacterium sp.]